VIDTGATCVWSCKETCWNWNCRMLLFMPLLELAQILTFCTKDHKAANDLPKNFSPLYWKVRRMAISYEARKP